MAGKATAVGKISGRKVGHMSLWQILTNKYVLILGLIYAGSSATSNALSLWQPDREVVRDVQHGNRVPKRHSVRNSVGRDDLWKPFQTDRTRMLETQQYPLRCAQQRSLQPC